MKTYRPGTVTDSELRRELSNVEAASQRADPFLEMEYLHEEPARARPGMLVLADGSDWDPGSGTGMYRRNGANDAWIFIG